MGKLNMKDWIGQTILNKKVISIPIMTHPGIELIGKTVHDAVTNGQVHYEAIKALCDKYPAAAATVIMDLTVEAEAFGAELYFRRMKYQAYPVVCLQTKLPLMPWKYQH